MCLLLIILTSTDTISCNTVTLYTFLVCSLKTPSQCYDNFIITLESLCYDSITGMMNQHNIISLVAKPYNLYDHMNTSAYISQQPSHLQ